MYGDEPQHSKRLNLVEAEFPVCTGMNRPGRWWRSTQPGVPRVYGDEPFDNLEKKRIYVSSPCVRG